MRLNSRPATILLDKGVVRRVYENRARLAEGATPTFLQAEAASAYARLRALQQRLYLTQETTNVLRLRPPLYAARLLAQTQALSKGRYLRRWARRLRDYVFTREDAVILAFGMVVMSTLLHIFLSAWWLCVTYWGTQTAITQKAQSNQPPIYETRANHDPEGTGKFYLGREIAHVMGYAGASWLERPERVEEEQPDRVVVEMKLKPSDVVADVGAGTGYFSFRLSRVVRQGKVYAVDIQPQMLALVEQRKQRLKAENVVTVRSTEKDVKLPDNSVDVVLMVDVYHEFEFPYEMMQSIKRALKPGGRIVQIEYRGEDPDVPIKRTHKMTVQQARKEMEFVGLVWKETKDFLPQQHFLVFEKPR